MEDGKRRANRRRRGRLTLDGGAVDGDDRRRRRAPIDDLEMRTDKAATITPPTDAPGAVTSTEDARREGTGSRSTTPKRMRLLGDVHTVLRHGGCEVLARRRAAARDARRLRSRRRRPAGRPRGATRSPTRAKSNGDDKDGSQTFFGFGGTKSKEPITITSDTLEYEYKDGIIVYRGDVLAVQGEVKIKSNELRITLAKTDDGKKKNGDNAVGALDDASASKLQSVVATGSVRIDQGTKWAVGGKATFDQSNRTLVLTENPVMHDGPNEVAGDRVVVYLDENRSVVEGGRKRVKAVLFPDKDGRRGRAGSGEGGGWKPALPAAKATEGKPAPGAVSKAGEAAR
jgi:lipopolysaccharide export system protein LptA